MPTHLESWFSDSGVGILDLTSKEFSYLKKDMYVPSGVVVVNGTIWVADYMEGVLRQLSATGEVLKEFEGLEGPMGITQAPNGDLCIAELRAAKISCYSLSSFD